MDPVEEIRTRLDIVDVISKYVELKRAGRNYKALCPFHSEKTPSFVVFPDTQTWRCFGACAEGGDVYSFLMKKNGWDFAEALRVLAEQTGVELRPRTPEQARQREEHARLYQVLEAATLYFMHLLRNAPEAEPARDYVVERGLLPHISEQFQLGYALDRWDGARTYLHDKGYTDEDLLAAGLLIEKEDSGRRYDRFRGRLMIPIRDLRGRVVGFGARALQPDAVPKYLNSPQTDLFDKSKLLYGLDMAKKGIREAGQAVIVEGYMDVMQGQQAGFDNIVAQMGTALTEPQLRQLKRYTGRLVLALDSDAAGQKATLRGLDVARQTLDRQVDVIFDPRGLVRHESRLRADIRIATLPAGYDPDKLIKSDPVAWAQLIAGARPVVEYILDAIVTGMDLTDAKFKSAAVARAMPIIHDVSNAVERNHYTQYLARRLEVDERMLVNMTVRIGGQQSRKLPKRGRTPAPAPPPPPEWDETGAPIEPARPRQPSAPRIRELYCLNQLITVPGILQQVDRTLGEYELGPISVEDFTDPQNRVIFAALLELSSPLDLPNVLDQALFARLDEIKAQHTPKPNLPTERVNGNHIPADKQARDLAQVVLLVRKEIIENAKQEANSALLEAQTQHDEDAIGTYLQQVLELEKRRRMIHQALGNIGNPFAGSQERPGV